MSQQSKDKVLLYFSAPWCVICKTTAPIVDDLITEGAPIQKVDVSQEKDQLLANQLGVMTLPNFVLMKNGKPSAQLQGRQTKESLLDLLK